MRRLSQITSRFCGKFDKFANRYLRAVQITMKFYRKIDRSAKRYNTEISNYVEVLWKIGELVKRHPRKILICTEFLCRRVSGETPLEEDLKLYRDPVA